MNRLHLLGLACLIAQSAVVIIPPIAEVKGIQTVRIPPLLTTRDNLISAEVALGKIPVDYAISVSIKASSSEFYLALYNASGNGNSISLNCYLPGERVTASVMQIKILVESSCFSTGKDEKVFDCQKGVSKIIALANEYVDSYTSPNNFLFYTRFSNKTVMYSEKFSFNNFYKEQKQKYYNYLDINNFSIKYICAPNPQLTAKETYLYIRNINDWFKNVGTAYGQFRKVPLKLVNVNSEYHFTLVKPLYIDPKTNNLYSTYQDGLVLTDKLYLPKNGMGSVSTIQINLNCKGVGHNEATLTQNFLFSISRNYFGDCYNSQYCISGEEAEPNFEFGEVEEH